MEQAEHHAHNLGLHLAHTWKHVRMDGVRHGELSKGVRLQLEKVAFAVIHGARHEAVLPSRVVHVRQSLQLCPHSVSWEPFLGQDQLPSHACVDKLALEFVERLLHLFANLAAHAGRAEEVAIADSLDVAVELEDGADDASTLEFPVCSTCPS